MNVLGRYFTPPMGFPWGGPGNYFPEPNLGDASVYGGTRNGCVDWVFATSNGLCGITPANPVRAADNGRRCILRSIKCWDVETSGTVRLRQWHSRAADRHIRLEIPVHAGVVSSAKFGLHGVDIGTMPYIECSVTAAVSLIYDIA
jgi:hypothetical protein